MIRTNRFKFGFECSTPQSFVVSQVRYNKLLKFHFLFSDLAFVNFTTNKIDFQWQNNSNGCLNYLIYGWILATYFNFVFILSIYTANECIQLDFYLIYLTNWNVMLNALSSLFGAILITLHYNNKLFSPSDGDDTNYNRMTNSLKVNWFLSNLSSAVSICVSLAYWPSYNGRDAGLNDVLTHAGNSVVLFADTFIHCRPPRYGHFVYPLGFGILYLIGFSLPYQLFGGVNRDFENYIYPSVDWANNTIDAVRSASLMSVLFVIVHLLLTLLIVARSYLHGKCMSYQMDKRLNREYNCYEQSVV